MAAAARGYGRRQTLEDPVAQLVSQAKQGDRKAFDALYTQHQARILAYCVRLLHNAAEGEQAAQDVFVQAWLRLESFRFESPFAHWLLSIATRTCLNLCRTKKSRDAAQGVTLDSPDTLAVVEARQPHTEMEDAVIRNVYADQLLRKIRHRARTARPPWDALDWHIFHLLYEQDVATAREVARRLGKSEDTVKYRIYKRINAVLTAVRTEEEAERTLLQHASPSAVSE